MAYPLDLFGQKFNKLAVIERAPKKHNTRWLCRCDCGNYVIVATAKLRSGYTKSCGCLKNKSYNKTHGLSRSAEYGIWGGMIDRTTNKTTPHYKNYGGRGITVCDRWKKFVNFLEDMGPRPNKDLSLDRIDNDKGYSLENCKWSTKKEQARNRRTNNRITIDGVTKLAIEWFELSNISNSTYYSRKRRGLNNRQALGI